MSSIDSPSRDVTLLLLSIFSSIIGWFIKQRSRSPIYVAWARTSHMKARYLEYKLNNSDIDLGESFNYLFCANWFSFLSAVVHSIYFWLLFVL